MGDLSLFVWRMLRLALKFVLHFDETPSDISSKKNTLKICVEKPVRFLLPSVPFLSLLLFTYLGRVALQTNFYFGLKKSAGKSNELVASNRIPLLAQRALGSLRGKQRKLLHRNV